MISPFSLVFLNQKRPRRSRPRIMSQLVQLQLLLWKNVYASYIRRHPILTLVQMALALYFVYHVRRDMHSDTELPTRYAVPAEYYPPLHPLDGWSLGSGPSVTTLYYTSARGVFFDKLAVRAATVLNITKVRRHTVVYQGISIFFLRERCCDFYGLAGRRKERGEIWMPRANVHDALRTVAIFHRISDRPCLSCL